MSTSLVSDEANKPKGKRILAVDDQANVVEFIKVNLERLGYEVETTEDGLQAFTRIKERKPYLLITDAFTFVKRGYLLTEAVRSDKDLADLPVLVMRYRISVLPAGKNFDAEEMRFRATGQDRTILKPFNPKELIAVLDAMLGPKLPTPEGKRVLVVDDVPEIVQIIQTILESATYEVETAENGSQALAKIKANPPDLLITDNNMPNMNGLELIEAVRSDTMTISLPILLMVSRIYDRPLPDVDYLLSQGANRVITKPFCPAELLAILSSMLLDSAAKDEQ